MGRRRKKKGGRLVADDVLAGRARASVEELLQLIHQTNPTDLGLSKKETADRYATKSRLQSVLLRDHFDKVRTTPEQGGDVIAIAHRYGAGDACHAPVSELDEDVRAKVRRYLDEEAAPSPPEEVITSSKPQELPPGDEPPPAELADLSEAELIGAGQAALESWDYDRARASFSLAVARSGSAQAAKSLLELLVDHLGLDREALAVSPRLSRDALRDEDVRGLLGVAAARTGDVSRAADFIEGVRTPKSAEVCVILADHSCKQGDERALNHWLKTAKDRGAPQYELGRLESALAKLREARRTPLEEELERVWETGDLEQSKHLAEELLREHPGSSTARRVLRDLRELDDQRRQQELLELFEEALSSGETALALNHLRGAVALGGDRAEELRQRLTELEKQERERRQEQELANVIKLVEAGALAKGLLGYTRLDNDQRARVRDEFDSPMFGWLEELDASKASTKARSSFVDGVLAFHQAHRSLAEGQAAEAESLLGQHERVLRSLKAFKSTRATVNDALARAAVAEQQALLNRAEQDFNRGDVRQARIALSRLNTKILPAGDFHRLAELDELLRHEEEVERLAKQVELYETNDDLLEAWRLAGQLAQLMIGAERDRWKEHQEDLGRRLRRQWRVETTNADGMHALVGFRLPLSKGIAPVWLTEDGRRVILATSRSDWLFIWVLNVESSEIEECVSLRTPKPLGDYIDTIVDGVTVWFIGSEGCMLELALEDWDIMSWRNLSEIMNEDEIIEDTCYLPGSRYLWIMTHSTKGYAGCSIIDLERWRVHRSRDDVSMAFPVISNSEPLVFVEDFNEEHATYDARGAPPSDLLVPKNPAIETAVIHPSGDGLLLLNRFYDFEGDESSRLTVCSLRPDCTTTEELLLDGSESDYDHAAVTSLEQNLSFVMFHTSNKGVALVCLSPSSSGFDITCRKPVGPETMLVQDVRSNHVIAITQDSDDSVCVARLERTLPDLPEHRRRIDGPLPDFGESLFCRGASLASSDLLKTARKTLPTLIPSRRRRWVDNYLDDHKDDPIAMAELVEVLDSLSMNEETDRLLSWFDEKYPDHPLIFLFRADKAVKGGNWEEARHLLEGIDSAELDEARGRHYHHLFGIALFSYGDIKGAHETWLEGKMLEGRCNLDPYIDLTADLPDVPDPRTLGLDVPLVRRLRMAIRAYDEAASTGDYDAALRAIDQPWVWGAAEKQSTARLAEAYLRTSVTSPQREFRRRFALASFIRACNERAPLYPRELQLESGQWSAQKLEQLIEEIEELS